MAGGARLGARGSPEEAMSKASALATVLDKLDLFSLQPAVRSLLESGQLVIQPQA